ncbi:HMG box domain-containing protein [Mycena indigotica]|uniref:HMG box domain-containing protein n=1 Tax=Mycena indigotica TaxID=2126181 RepID=A0A8H6T5P0_9AGAR|nr:HMG box domain-containing protein [Mycena indigotica]KAF7309865.1 HMG box domain-containing protein [Mycena indigotica]
MPPSRLFGWAPANADGDDVQVDASSTGQFTFQVRAQGSPATLPTSMGFFSSPDDNHSQEHTPRPRNAFIIFRTEFARLHHSPETSKQRRIQNKSSGRTVSGKAADAWNKLSERDRAHYNRLAEIEKEEHARRYPNYQYRPRRRGSRVTRRPSVLTPSVTITSPPPQKRRRTRASSFISSDEESSSESSAPPSSPESDFHLNLRLPHEPQPTIVTIDEETKGDRRRSSSVPVTLNEHDYLTAAGWPASVVESTARNERQWELRPTMLQSKRRSRSVTEADLASLGIPPSYETDAVQYTPRLANNLTIDPASLFSPMHIQVSSSSSSSSSLANWNGELEAAQTPAPSPITSAPTGTHIAPLPLRLDTPSWLPETYNSQWPLDSTGHYVPMPPIFARSMSDPGVGGELTVTAILQQQQEELARAAKEQDDAAFATYFSLSGLDLESPTSP